MIVSQPHAVFSRRRGFTLIELLVAMVIFAVLATMAYGGLRSIINTSTGVQQQIARLEELQRGIMMFERDVRQVALREMNTDFGKKDLAFRASDTEIERLQFSKSGNPNPAGLNRSSLQRVVYTFEENALWRLTWDRVDHLTNDEPQSLKLIDNIESVSLKYLDNKGDWVPEWASADIPRAIEIIINHKSWGEIRRLIPLLSY